MEKNAISQAGLYQNFSQKNSIVFPSYIPTISFSEFYSERFREISPHNLFRLTEKLICSKKLSPHMLRELSIILSERINTLND